MLSLQESPIDSPDQPVGALDQRLRGPDRGAGLFDTGFRGSIGENAVVEKVGRRLKNLDRPECDLAPVEHGRLHS
jgi:hypothetical protein